MFSVHFAKYRIMQIVRGGKFLRLQRLVEIVGKFCGCVIHAIPS